VDHQGPRLDPEVDRGGLDVWDQRDLVEPGAGVPRLQRSQLQRDVHALRAHPLALRQLRLDGRYLLGCTFSSVFVTFYVCLVRLLADSSTVGILILLLTTHALYLCSYSGEVFADDDGYVLDKAAAMMEVKLTTCFLIVHFDAVVLYLDILIEYHFSVFLFTPRHTHSLSTAPLLQPHHTTHTPTGCHVVDHVLLRLPEAAEAAALRREDE